MGNLEEEEIIFLYSLFFIRHISINLVAIYQWENRPCRLCRFYSSQEYPANTVVFTTKYTQITR